MKSNYMKFDTLISLVEKHRLGEIGINHPGFQMNLVQILQNARVFDLSKYNAHEIVSKTITVAQYAEFYLPFQITAVEDRATCTILIDPEPGATGLLSPRYFIDFVDWGSDWEAFREDEQDFIRDHQNNLPNLGEYLITFGIVEMLRPADEKLRNRYNGADYSLNISQREFEEIMADQPDLEESSKYDVVGNVDQTILCTKKELIDSISINKIRHVDPDLAIHIDRSGLRNAIAAMQEIMLINEPRRFVLETTTNKLKKPNKKRKNILKSWERPLYTVLTPKKIYKTLGIKNPLKGEGAAKVPHPRRRHDRYLQADRYRYRADGSERSRKVNESGVPYYKKVHVPATWIGGTEAKIGNKRYKVRLDL